MIEIGSLHCAFGEFALRDISLRIAKGDYWVILGPSGCGKSVLLQTIAGFFAPTRGKILGIDLVSQQRRAALASGQEAGEHLHSCGFAAAIRADEAEDLPPADLQIYMVHRQEVAEAHGEARSLDGDLGIYIGVQRRNRHCPVPTSPALRQ